MEWYRGAGCPAGLFDLSTVPNSTRYDPTFDQFQIVGEIERDYSLVGKDGKVRLTGFLTRGRMGSFADAIRPCRGDRPAGRHRRGAPLPEPRRGRPRPGAAAAPTISACSLRAGWADGSVEPYEFTDIDQTVAAGLSLKGARWSRPDDTVGFGVVVNGISKIHQAFLERRGPGHPDRRRPAAASGPEQILETYYSVPVVKPLLFTFDYQFVANPAYNRDRGPVTVLGARLHAQY